jgi:type IV pilus assembly protein PilM
VPFDIEQAGLSYQVLSEGSSRLETQWKVLAAVTPGPVLSEYEAVVRMAGYEPGAVLPASLSVLSAIDSQEAVLVVNLSAESLTTAIVSGNDVLLYRTVELPTDQAGFQTEIQRSIAVAAAFFEDKLHVRPTRLIYSGVAPVRDFIAILDDSEIKVGEVMPRPALGRASALGDYPVAGVTGALAGTN